MTLLLGIDVGTTGAKTILINAEGRVLASATTKYPLLMPQPGWTEQDPEAWWNATTTSVRRVLENARISSSEVTGIGLTGQMHGLVPLDKAGQVLRPAILWNDQRTVDECAWITERVGAARVLQLTGNPVLSGFTAPKIIWMRRHEPDLYRQITHILLPKDFVRYRLTGEFVIDVTDASGTSLFDVSRRAWSTEMLHALDIPEQWLPRVAESPEVVGTVSRDAAAAWGLPAGLPVVAGAGDQAAQAVGTGIVRQGVVSVTIGTSGVVFGHLDAVQANPGGRLHLFCHAVPGRWHVMGVMLSAGGSLRWLRDSIRHESWFRGNRDPYDVMSEEAATVPVGAEGLIFLPYLTGERTPHADPHARGAFIGLTVRHQPPHLIRAVMEGVAMGLRDSLELIRAIGLPVAEIRASGGGARSLLWRQILADLFRADVATVSTTEGAAFGAALLAGVGCDVFAGVERACDATIAVTDRATPEPKRMQIYERVYEVYRDLYPAMRPAMHALDELV
jgi:xylulokinase